MATDEPLEESAATPAADPPVTLPPAVGVRAHFGFRTAPVPAYGQMRGRRLRAPPPCRQPHEQPRATWNMTGPRGPAGLGGGPVGGWVGGRSASARRVARPSLIEHQPPTSRASSSPSRPRPIAE